ncbi:type I-U CRISPR-associated helicase/endonuclease Cas3 [Raineyella sp.]|uniref:HD Cas3-type domain-containing protein n=1 Tax=bioreactor metagenome TaxID=1076179 RepID=A0A644X7L4_9ZZZZ|nr:type I-U CRISPR-associated helicase/endonuclease Cas3 [Raineyella sp.]MEA5153440.1 type I-U CRISPR-associated helicase/endonuclease Cas3 [Raineyella sp.]
MTLTTGDFAAFFAAINGDDESDTMSGPTPFSWQQRLLDHMVSSGAWPDRIAAPTGSGKSHVVDTHIFATALSACGAAPRLPRRLAVVVDRRALVDSQVLRAQKINSLLLTSDNDVVKEVARLLRTLRTTKDRDESSAEPVVVAELRGGLAPDSHWLDDPSVCAVIGATPDMWGSRLLMRGYGSRPYARPREAGLLAYDSVMVLDEAHLNAQLLRTARRVGELAAQFEADLGLPPLQVVETTATPDTGDPATTCVAVEPDDLDRPEDRALARRLLRPKPLTMVESPAWPSRTPAPQTHIVTIADQARMLRQGLGKGGRTVGCVVNHVDTAVRVTRELSRHGLATDCWVGRRRPMDIAKLMREHPGLFDPTEPQTLDVLVATQTVEVGLDIDFGGLVTELAPGPALAQRAGRVNRKGMDDSARIVVVGPPSDAEIRELPPYRSSDLTSARTWLRELDSAGLTPWAVRCTPPPAKSAERRFMRPELTDAWRWAATADDTFEAETLSLWLQDDLDEGQTQGGLVLRRPLPKSDSETLELLLATEPDQAETFPVPLSLLRSVVDRVLAAEPGAPARAFLYRPRPQEVSVTQLDSSKDLRPGDVVIVDAGHPLTEHGVVTAEPPSTPEKLDTTWGAEGALVAVRDAELPDSLRSWPDILEDLAGLDTQSAQRACDLRWAEEVKRQITLPSSAGEVSELPWLVLTDIGSFNRDEAVRQEWTVSGRPVPLADHGNAVAERADRLVRLLGVGDRFAVAVVNAARLHDTGKDDERFQRFLGRRDEEPALAKSSGRTPQQLRRGKRAVGLPAGWRHELRSVLHADMTTQGDAADRDLVLRLVGTSHGYGRYSTPQTAGDLLRPNDPDEWHSLAHELFDCGGWAEIVGATDRELGVWACAYLEALVRAADCQVSREGS